jgi:uncharacterized protein (DUF302 family)
MRQLIARVDRYDGVFAMTAGGLISCVSKFGPKETMDRLGAAVTTQGISIMARIDYAAAAAAVGMELRPTEVLIFGNPRAGTPLMQAVQAVGIDLPLKALVWQDESGATWLAYNDPQWLAQRHGVDAGLDRTLTLWPMPSWRSRGRQPRHPHGNRSGVRIGYVPACSCQRH